jgi:phospholipid transport system transporter-binding protein
MSNESAFRLTQPAADTLGLNGELSFATAAAAWRALHSTLLANAMRRLDLSGLTRSDSAGLACVLAAQAQAARQGGRMEVLGMPEDMRALARLCEVEALTG